MKSSLPKKPFLVSFLANKAPIFPTTFLSLPYETTIQEYQATFTGSGARDTVS